MLEIRGPQQSDAWLRARCGRITGSKLADVCDYVSKGSIKRGDKSVESGSKRTKYRREVIAERLTGRLADHWNSEFMAHGEREEEPARIFYESITRQMVIPVSFVIHPEYSFTGSSADGLIGDDGVLEIKNPNTTTHLGYMEDDILPVDYTPQVGWELACAGKERRWADFLSFDRRIQDPKMCYFLKRVGRDELEWEVPKLIDGKVEQYKLTGESVIDYFTSEVLKFNAEIEYFFAERSIRPIAPFAVQLQDENELDGVKQLPASDGYDPSKPFHAQDLSFLEQGNAALCDIP